MDDNKILTLASNERIAVTPDMRLIFEISNLRTATPATVSRAGILYISPADLGWQPPVTTWIEGREKPTEKVHLNFLFDKYLPQLYKETTRSFRYTTPIASICHVQVLCSLLETLLASNNLQDAGREQYEIYFVFCLIWSFGSALCDDGQTNSRNEFSKVHILIPGDRFKNYL